MMDAETTYNIYRQASLAAGRTPEDAHEDALWFVRRMQATGSRPSGATPERLAGEGALQSPASDEGPGSRSPSAATPGDGEGREDAHPSRPLPTVLSQAEYGRMGYEALVAKYGLARVRAWRRRGGRKPNSHYDEISLGATGTAVPRASGRGSR